MISDAGDETSLLISLYLQSRRFASLTQTEAHWWIDIQHRHQRCLLHLQLLSTDCLLRLQMSQQYMQLVHPAMRPGCGWSKHIFRSCFSACSGLLLTRTYDVAAKGEHQMGRSRSHYTVCQATCLTGSTCSPLLSAILHAVGKNELWMKKALCSSSIDSPQAAARGLDLLGRPQALAAFLHQFSWCHRWQYLSRLLVHQKVCRVLQCAPALEQLHVAILNQVYIKIQYLTVKLLAVAHLRGLQNRQQRHLQLTPDGRVLRPEQCCVQAGKALVVQRCRRGQH